MLVAFTLENYKSFREQQTLSFVSGNGDEHLEHTILLKNGLRINRFAALIGGNGSGKTQLLTAINDFARAIHNDDLHELHTPYLFSKECRLKATSYEVIILDEEKENFYRYGVSVFAGNIESEYLYARPVKKGSRESCIFTRDANGVSFKKAEYKKHEALIKPILKSSGAVVTFSRSLEIFELNETRYWALQQLPYSPDSFLDDGLEFFEERLESELRKDENGKKIIDKKTKALINMYGNFITKSPLHIDGVDFIPTGSEKKYHFVYKIKNLDGGFTSIGPNERYQFFSQGTINILTFLAALIWASDGVFTLYVDEVDASIHHSLATTLISDILKFYSSRDDMQFVLSTHNIPLLDECFRRDELNIIIKDDSKSSKIINAANFSVRKDAKISAKYFRGEFGALPSFLGFSDYENEK
ncbi:AAA family ATPase [Pantoea ananatis]